MEFVVGFDLGKDVSQISCWNEKSREPVSVSIVPGEEKFRIPTENLEQFMKKSMRLLKPYGKMHEASAVVFSVDEVEEKQTGEIRRMAMQFLGIPESRIFVQSRQESFCAYVVNQAREFWRHQAVLFECEGELLQASVLTVNSRTIPAIARVEQEESWCVPVSGLQKEEKDELLQRLARELFSERPVSSVYLVGGGFEGDWYEESLKMLCGAGRRVFAGNNLFAKGACYSAMQETKPVEERGYIFLGKDKISYNVGLVTPGVGKNSVFTLLNAGTSWYEAKAECTALLCTEPVVEFLLKPLQGKEILKESLLLEGLPDRPSRTSRLRIRAEFKSVDRLQVTVTDLGFGELFPSSDLSWSEEVQLS